MPSTSQGISQGKTSTNNESNVVAPDSDSNVMMEMGERLQGMAQKGLRKSDLGRSVLDLQHLCGFQKVVERKVPNS